MGVATPLVGVLDVFDAGEAVGGRRVEDGRTVGVPGMPTQ